VEKNTSNIVRSTRSRYVRFFCFFKAWYFTDDNTESTFILLNALINKGSKTVLFFFFLAFLFLLSLIFNYYRWSKEERSADFAQILHLFC
jgi:hypothetical protein